MFSRNKLRTINQLERYLMITLGVFLMVAGFYYFLIPANVVAGGVTGIGLILNYLFDFSISIFIAPFFR